MVIILGVPIFRIFTVSGIDMADVHIFGAILDIGKSSCNQLIVIDK